MYIPLHRTVCVSLASYCVGQSIPMLETLDWRAVCGKTARTVRREGRARVLPYPYRVRARSRVERQPLHDDQPSVVSLK